MILDERDVAAAVHRFDAGVVVASRFHLDGTRVHAPDGDGTTMLIDALETWHRHGFVGDVDVVLSGEEAPIVSASLPWLTVREEAQFVVHRFAHGAAVLHREQAFDAAAITVAPALHIEVNMADHEAMEAAWALERSEQNVSQGAYVSGQVHQLGLVARLGMQAQAGPVWPPRGADPDGGAPHAGPTLSMRGRVVSWTRLIAAGCPSEFAIRAPVLDGLTSMILAFDEGPSGVFLHADGHPSEVAIDDEVNLVVRRIYAQDGMLRYGRKAIRA